MTTLYGHLLTVQNISLVSNKMNENNLIWEAYEKVPDSLMGFRRDGQLSKRGYEGEKFKHIQAVRVIWPDGDSIEEALKGLNKAHALERARRNWPTASEIIPLEMDEITDMELKHILLKSKEPK